MSFLRSLFRRRGPRPRLDHPLFGRIAYSRDGRWENRSFELWGHEHVDLLIDAPASGPTRDQEQTFVRFRDSRETLLPRCLEAVAAVRRETASGEDVFQITGLSIPALSDERAGRLWTLWLDCGDEQFWYGVQTEDEWSTLAAFADD